MAVRRGMESRYCRSCSGSRTCCSNTSVKGGGHARSSSNCALGSEWSGKYIATALGHSAATSAPCASDSTSICLSRSACAVSSAVVANTYSLMKHCFASAQQKPSSVSLTAVPLLAVRRRSRRIEARNRSRSTLRTVVDSSTRGSSASEPIAAKSKDPSKSRVGSRCGHERALKAAAGGVPLALRKKHAAEVVAGFGVIRLERQDLLVELDRLVRLAVVLVPDCLAEQAACRLRR